MPPTSTDEGADERSSSANEATGALGRGLGTANRMSAPYQAVKAKDGYFVLGRTMRGFGSGFASRRPPRARFRSSLRDHS